MKPAFLLCERDSSQGCEIKITVSAMLKPAAGYQDPGTVTFLK